MNVITIIGIILIVLGVVGLIYGGITYTFNKNIIMGPLHLRVNQTDQIPQSPNAGAAAVVVGVKLIIVALICSRPRIDTCIEIPLQTGRRPAGRSVAKTLRAADSCIV